MAAHPRGLPGVVSAVLCQPERALLTRLVDEVIDELVLMAEQDMGPLPRLKKHRLGDLLGRRERRGHHHRDPVDAAGHPLVQLLEGAGLTTPDPDSDVLLPPHRGSPQPKL